MTSKFFQPQAGCLVTVPPDDVEMHVVSRGAGRPIVFIHGVGWNHALWAQQLSTFQDQYTVVAGDSRGHGLSSKPAGPYTMAQMTADWSALLSSLGIDKCALVGLSQGGMIAMSLASQEPERFSALVLFSTACRYSDEARTGMQSRALVAQSMGPKAAAEATANSIFSAQFLSENQAFVEEFIDQRVAADAKGIAAAIAALDGFDFSERIGRIKCPTLIVHGAADRVAAPSNATDIAQRIPGSELVWMDGGHILPVECPQAVQSTLETFFGTHYAP